VTSASNILVVEDGAIVSIFIQEVLATQGYRVTLCDSAERAWQRLSAAPEAYQAVLLDRGLPGMDGMSLLRQLKQDPRLCHVPVVMETKEGDLASIREGIAAGAYHYLVKPLQGDLLLAVVSAAVGQYQVMAALRAASVRSCCTLKTLDRGRFSCCTLEEANQLAQLLASAFPDPERVVQGLLELLVNAIEHGNLGITYEEKGALLVADGWHDEVDRRLALPENRHKRVEVAFERRPETIEVTIRDQGPGFKWVKYLTFDPDRAVDPHGRGIALAHAMSFDTLDYIGKGNTVQVAVLLPPAGAED